MTPRPVLELLAGLALGGCHMGTGVGSFAPAMHPGGVLVSVDSHDAAFRAELLAVSDTGLLLANDSGLVYAPYRAIRRATFEQLDDEISRGETPDRATRDRLRLISRFPQGVSPERLQALLARHHQDALRVLGP